MNGLLNPILPPFRSSIALAYDPLAGRWTQRDPIDYHDSLNLYHFCGNNPVNTTDRDGGISEAINAEHIPGGFTDIKRLRFPLAMTAPVESMLDPLVDTTIDNAPLTDEQKIQAKIADSILTARVAGGTPVDALKRTVKDADQKAVAVTADGLVEKAATTPSDTTHTAEQDKNL